MKAEQVLQESEQYAKKEEWFYSFFYPNLTTDHSPEETSDTTAFCYPYESDSNHISSGQEAELNSETNITIFSHSASSYQEDLDGQTLLDNINTEIVRK